MEINRLQLDALREIGNIGSGHAATALSTMLNRRIEMSVPEIKAIPFQEAASVMGELDIPQAVIYVKVEGEAPGEAVFFIPLESAQILVQALFNSDENYNLFENEMAQSALMEMGNIMVSSFIIALTEFSKVPLAPSVPALAVDMVGAIFDAIILEDGVLEDTVIFINTHLTGIPKIEGKFVFLPDEGSLTKLLGALGV